MKIERSLIKFTCDNCGKVSEELEDEFPYKDGWKYLHNINTKINNKDSPKEFSNKHFCSNKCMHLFIDNEIFIKADDKINEIKKDIENKVYDKEEVIVSGKEVASPSVNTIIDTKKLIDNAIENATKSLVEDISKMDIFNENYNAAEKLFTENNEMVIPIKQVLEILDIARNDFTNIISKYTKEKQNDRKTEETN